MESATVALLTVVLVTATYTDLRSSRIPNSLTFTAMAIGLITHACLSGVPGILFSLEGLGAGLGLFLLLYASGGIGAGDVKLMAAVGAIVGPYGALLSGLLTIIVGGAYAFGAMCYHWGVAAAGRRLVDAAYGTIFLEGNAWTRQLQLPFRLRYGLAVAGGTLLYQLGLHPFVG